MPFFHWTARRPQRAAVALLRCAAFLAIQERNSTVPAAPVAAPLAWKLLARKLREKASLLAFGNQSDALLPAKEALGYPVNYPTLVLNVDGLLVEYIADKDYGWVAIKKNGADGFLRDISSRFEIVVWSKDSYPFPQKVVSALDVRTSGILTREQCRRQGSIFAKDVSRLNRPLDRLLIIDSDRRVFGSHESNGIVVSSQPDEAELARLSDVLLQVASSKTDLRQAVQPFINEERRVCTVRAPTVASWLFNVLGMTLRHR